MRIIGGEYRGMKLAEFGSAEIRPTADRVKESLFNIIFAYVGGAEALDLFCGSGNLGIECLSRGARHVHFNDISKNSIAVLKKNLSRLKRNDYSVTCSDFKQCLSRGGRYDIIFIDSPYASEAGVQALEIIGGGLLKQDGIAVYERDVPFTHKIAGLEMYDERKYGKTYLTFFRAENK